MSEHKYTDEEVIKALEYHSDPAKTCVSECAYGYQRYCGSKMAKDALDLINRQKVEIERLHSEVKEKTETIVFLKDQATGWSIDFCNLKKKLNTAKAEAIKEFAEKLKEKAYVNKPYGVGKSVDECDIDALVKEMTEI